MMRKRSTSARKVGFYLCAVLLEISAISVAAEEDDRGAVADVAKRAQACYQGLGCFSDFPQLRRLPMSPDKLQTQFQLYTRNELTVPTRINATFNESTWATLLHGSHFNPHKDTKFVIHGFTGDGNKTWVIGMKDALLHKGDFNVIVVDWGQGAKQLPDQAAINVFLVAAEVTNFIRFLQGRHNPLDLNKVHVIGHSFGAQISGNVGAALGGALARISGLDPAEPYFVDMDDSKRLDKTDAKFVDVIHTDGEKFSGFSGYGWIHPMGHLDFYPNGGYDQPGCEDDILGGIVGILGAPDGSDESLACSHGRASLFFIESISSSTCQFTAHPCSNWTDYTKGKCHTCPPEGCPVMGYDADSSSARGIFYLPTTMKSPFCGYEYIVEMDMTDNHTKENAFGRFYITLHGQHDSKEAEFSRDNVHYQQRYVETEALAVNGSVGDIHSVEVRFHHQGGLLGWGTDSVVYLHEVIVRDTTTGNRYVFCTRDQSLSSDAPANFTNNNGC